MFGRDEEARAIESLVRAGERVVTLTGVGGIGKSRLAERIADAVGAGETRVVRCSLAEARSLADFTRSVARAANVDLAALRADDALATLGDVFATGGPRLILLDDAEAVIAEAARALRTWTARSGATQFLVTSREPLVVPGEIVRPLAPLSDDAAAAMFVDVAARAGHPVDRDKLAPLLALLDGVPLAIEIAARRAGVLSPEEIATRLATSLDVLSEAARHAPTRHATVRETIAWSWASLDEAERTALLTAAAFAGPFDLASFEAIADAEHARPPLDVAHALVNKSLLVRPSPARARLAMPNVVRAFAREKLAESPLREAIEARHVAHYVALAERLARRAYGPHAVDALDALGGDVDEYLLAFERAASFDPAAAARLAIALEDLLLFRSLVDLRSDLFARAVVVADATDDRALSARTRILRAKVTLEIGAPSDAVRDLEDALRVATEAQREDIVADARRSLGWAQIAAGAWDEAAAHLDVALAMHRTAKHVRGEADALAAMGVLAALGGDAERSRTHLRASRALHVRSRDPIRREKVESFARLFGYPAESLGDARAASDDDRDALAASIAQHRARGQRWREAVDLYRLAEWEKRDGHADEARALVGEALAAAEDVASAFASSPFARARGIRTDARESRWRIAADARSLETPSGTRIDLARHGPLRRVLDALVALRHEHPGAPLSVDRVLAIGWPGERVRHDSGLLRVYTTVRRLRKLALGDVLLTRDDGYLLDPASEWTRGE